MSQTRTLSYKSLQFNELSDAAKEKALEWARDIDLNTGYDWWDSVFDDAKEVGKLMGITVDNIFFSGFASQGDGACFEGSYQYNKGGLKEVMSYAPQDEELHRIAVAFQETQKPAFYGLSARVKHRGHYYHKYETDIDVFDATGDYASKEFTEAVTDLLRDFMEWIYRQLEKEYDYQTSDEALIETIEANEYEFFQDGNRSKNITPEMSGELVSEQGVC